jgi:cancer susceptibility candidate protein 1
LLCRLEAEDLVADIIEARHSHLQFEGEIEEWDRYISCNPLPKPMDESSLSDYLVAEALAVPESVEEALARMQAAITVIREIDSVNVWLTQLGKDKVALLKHKRGLMKLVSHISDMATAWFLHRCDNYADEEGGIRFEHILNDCHWGIWLNVNKNPRTKMVEFPILHLNVEIQKQVALAPVAIRVQLLPIVDEYNDVCTNELMAIGPVMAVDLLTLPPSSKPTVRQWVIRFHGPLTHSISKIPYPIPPAGADPNTWTSDEDIAPLTVTADVEPKMMQFGDQEPQVPLPKL